MADIKATFTTVSTFACGCRVTTDEHFAEKRSVAAHIDYCPLHAAANEMYEVLEEARLVFEFERLDDERKYERPILRKIRTVIALAGSTTFQDTV